MSSSEARALILSQWKLWVTLAATGLATLRLESHKVVAMWKLTVVQ